VNFLAFESSTKLGSVALIQNGVCTFSKKSASQKSHSEILHQFVFEILKDASLQLKDIDCFAAGCGPGSFTGIRVSLNTAKAFSYAFQKPMVVIDSLRNLAQLNLSLVDRTKVPSAKILCLINAYKNMSYYAIYDFGPDDQTKVVKDPSVIPMKDIKLILTEPILTVGDGFQTYESFLPESIRSKMLRPTGVIDDPSAESLGILADQQIKQGLTLDWKSTKPLYIRSSEAEETKRGIVWSPLDFKE
jgi:tRNA threonylcarbamoyladenosine biosynthesis protein TsaB